MDTGKIIESFNTFIAEIDLVALIHRTVIILLSIFLILAVFKLLKVFLGRLFKGKISESKQFMVYKGIRYASFVIIVLFVLNSLGINTTAILGAAGIAGIAIGFAAQTSVSNLISGLFLLSEKPFAIGDTIRVDNTVGTVLSVDLLSVKLRTADNLFVRIPNETIIKSSLTTITRYPTRRVDLAFSVARKEDLEKVRNTLLELAAENQYCLKDPAPFFGIDNFGDSGINILFNLWVEKSNFWNLKNSILINIKKRFETEGIEIAHQKINVEIVE